MLSLLSRHNENVAKKHNLVDIVMISSSLNEETILGKLRSKSYYKKCQKYVFVLFSLLMYFGRLKINLQ